MPHTPAANLFADLPARLPEELFTVLAESASVRIERIVSPPGHQNAPDSWYDQERDEWVLVLRGSAGLEIEGEPDLVELRPGDHLVLAAHRRHRVAWTSADEPTLWLAVHYA
jgi:cupin 2 domain-containing protein